MLRLVGLLTAVETGPDRNRRLSARRRSWEGRMLRLVGLLTAVETGPDRTAA